jgi:predicted nucleic acid-binding Zn ribbon protein
MPVYVYETTDDDAPRRFEIRQSMNDPALTADPATGRPVRRVISGGFGFLRKAGADAASAPSSGGHACGGGGCGCH